MLVTKLDLESIRRQFLNDSANLPGDESQLR
jgi:hypothetical protein